MKIAVIIPTYNEKENIKRLIPRIFSLGIEELEIVVVDDNSPDGTGKIVETLKRTDNRVHLLSRPRKMGLGTAYLAGFRYSLDRGAEYIFEMDADFSHDFRAIPKFLEAAGGHDLIVGSRYKNGISITNWPIGRLTMSLLANRYAALVTGVALTDMTSGFKCYRRKVLEGLDLNKIRSNGYSFQIEMKYRAHKKNFAIREIPIVFAGRHSGSSKISRLIVWEALWIVWKLRFGLI
ncbi:MAG: dolichyl-phosphate beta-D-mannosyltransferase [Candidatus Moranbacteria bacterium RIFOXYB1_FULL_43_19]|nr:MAG: dolichyl-phosphate beta-D-mannosyltransferase [Candidatus Moranbacteria bacterium RIFOXYB1_FULL_43_19]OGI27967.1 MAG: dolichyl-phosphate beta-D-mannosyltransferase [Candidatus Moranbacteria bacterium RIFOXYA1_FULL_44_7]OGI32617.1 MAG: dolichyl-phosphate beta-D-mannosyltransferase [Candidatus Moranbacteria bacterium RIFOXYC1_FULL_44_13]OGI37850.1 MAG: dolichyl-phosphate beta-D-mannosyltransferase [Candidatus Moranbacteria bacterium RIFOXYD1_FULL_44_12]